MTMVIFGPQLLIYFTANFSLNFMIDLKERLLDMTKVRNPLES